MDKWYAAIFRIVWNMSYKQMGVFPLMLDIDSEYSCRHGRDRMVVEFITTYAISTYQYIYNSSLSPLTLWVQIPLKWGVVDATSCDKVCQWVATGWWLSLGTLQNRQSSIHNVEVVSRLHYMDFLDSCYWFCHSSW